MPLFLKYYNILISYFLWVFCDFNLIFFRLNEAGAKEVYCVFTHGILSGPAVSRLMDAAIKGVVVTNTIPQEEKIAQCPKIKVSV